MPASTESPPTFPIEFVAGIGAAAGAFEPLERFFAEMSASSGIAFVVVQHPPGPKGSLGELLARHTEMTICLGEEGMPLEPNSVYLIPPKMEMTVREGRLHRTARERSMAAAHQPIDAFLQSLANDFGRRAIGIIMSGTGSDGSRGIRSVNDAGGLTIGEGQGSEGFAGLPPGPIDSGKVARTLPPEEMPAAVMDHCNNLEAPDGVPHSSSENLRATIEQLKLANEHLKARNSDLAARNHELDQFAHAASHDLRSPLHSVVGFAEIIRGSLDDGDVDEAQRSLDRIDEAALRMGNLISSLLTFASVGRGQFAVDEVSLDQIFENVIKDLAPEIEAQGAIIRVDPELPRLEGDATMLHQVIQNLLANSIKYRGEARPEISVSASVRDRRVLLTIADNGIGFDPAEASRAFAPFQRLHSGHASGGSGIGLSICRRVVERHGGAIEVETAVGKGARFTVKLPTHQETVRA